MRSRAILCAAWSAPTGRPSTTSSPARRIELGDFALARRAIELGRPVVVADIPEDSRLSPAERAEDLRWGYTSLVELPLIDRGEAIGIATLFDIEHPDVARHRPSARSGPDRRAGRSPTRACTRRSTTAPPACGRSTKPASSWPRIWTSGACSRPWRAGSATSPPWTRATSTRWRATSCTAPPACCTARATTSGPRPD